MRKASIANLKRTAMLRGLTREVVRPGGELLGRGILGASESLNAYAGGIIAYDDFTGASDTPLMSHAGSPATWAQDYAFDYFALDGSGAVRSVISGLVSHTLSETPSGPAYKITFDYTEASGNNIGVMWKRSDNSNRYQLLITSAGWSLEKRVADVTTVLDSDSVTVGVTAWEVRVFQNTFTIYMDGALVSTVADSSLSGTGVGIVKTSGAPTGKMDNFLLQTLSAPIFVAGADNPDNPNIDFWVP